MTLALNDKQAYFEERSQALRIREEALRHKDLKLQHALLRIKPLLEENQAKKVRAEKRLLEEEKMTELKVAEVEEAAEALAAARSDVGTVAAAADRLSQYANYLVRFQQSKADDFPDVGAVLKRHATLVAAHEDLLAESARLGARVDEARRTLARSQKMRETQALTGANQIARLKERLEAARAEVRRHASGADAGAVSASQRALELGQMLRSVANLHARCVHGPYGGLLMHSPADADALGRGVGAAFEGVLRRFGAAPVTVAESAVAAAARSAAASVSEAALNAEVGDEATAGASMRASRRAPVFVAQADPIFFAVTAKLKGDRHTESSAAEDVNASGMEPKAIVGKVTKAIENLDVVASYLLDLTAIVDGYGGFLADARKAAAEKAATAASEEAKRSAADAVKQKAAAKRDHQKSAIGIPSKAVPAQPVGASGNVGAPRGIGGPAISPIASAKVPRKLGDDSFRGKDLGSSSVLTSAATRFAAAPQSAAAAATTNNITAEAKKIAANLAKSGVRAYFTLKTPLPPPTAGGSPTAAPVVGVARAPKTVHQIAGTRK